jgi:hypothetical protein
MRDTYTPSDPAYLAWLANRGSRTRDEDREKRRAWLDLIAAARNRGILVRRARIISEPVTDYIRFEWAGTPLNIEVGEQVRWLPRRHASDLCLPGNDFWVFDDRLIRFHHFSGEGEIVEDELVSDPAVIRLCCNAFEAAWERAIPHAEYRPG